MPLNGFKLYVWRKPLRYEGFVEAVAFAVARSLEEAIIMMEADIEKRYGGDFGRAGSQRIVDDLRRTPPDVYDVPVGVYLNEDTYREG